MRVCLLLLLGLFSLSIVSTSYAIYLPMQLVQNTPNNSQDQDSADAWNDDREEQIDEDQGEMDSVEPIEDDEDRIDSTDFYNNGNQPIEVSRPDTDQANLD